MVDPYGRKIDYMRISITDRCNLRCNYCMPEDIVLTAAAEILTFEEIAAVCQAGVKAGITKLRITGGEPLVRRGCTDLIAMLKSIPGIEKVFMTTNGLLLAEYGEALKMAGIDGVNISLDAMDPMLYQNITRNNGFDQVLSGLKAMIRLKIPVKINTVLIEGVNDGEWEAIADLAKKDPVDVRFIELMPMGTGKQYSVVSGARILEKIRSKYDGVREDRTSRGEGPAVYYRIPGFRGCIGFISAIHGKFCESCNRLRLTADGKLKPCLCYGDYIDIKERLRSHTGGSVDQGIQAAVAGKPDGHCFENIEKITENRKMSGIGG